MQTPQSFLLLALAMAINSLSRTALANDLICQTFLGNNLGESGQGTEGCVPGVNRCVARSYLVFNHQTYTLSCDDLFQCPTQVKDRACCTTPLGVTVRCFDENFSDTHGNTITRIDGTFFEPAAECSTPCSEGSDNGAAVDTAHGSASSPPLVSLVTLLVTTLSTLAVINL